MNDRIKELWTKCKSSGVHPEFGDYDKFSIDEYTRLVIDRCTSLMEWQKISPKDDGAYNSALSLAQRNIKEHFGIKE